VGGAVPGLSEQRACDDQVATAEGVDHAVAARLHGAGRLAQLLSPGAVASAGVSAGPMRECV